MDTASARFSANDSGLGDGLKLSRVGSLKPICVGDLLFNLAGKSSGYRLAAVAFVLTWIALCWPWLSGQWTIPFDAKAHFHAQIQFLAHALHSGQSPFWTPGVFGGSPQIADPQSLIFSPAILLALLSPSPSFRDVDAYVLLHLLAGGLALLMYFRDRKWHPAGGVLAAIVFAFGASAAWRIQHVGQIASLSYFAIAFWLTSRMLLRNSTISGVLAGCAASQMVIEPDQVALLGAYVLIGVVLAHWMSGRWLAIRSSFVPIMAGGLAGSLIISFPLLWTWLFAEASTRPEVDFVEAAHGSLHPASLLTAFVADLFGARDPGVPFWGPASAAWKDKGIYLSQNMGQIYLGALPMVLIIAPGLTRGWIWDKPVRATTILLVFMVLFALGWYTPFFQAFYDYLPGVKLFRRPADATFLIGALGAVLSGYVLHRLLTTETAGSHKLDLLVSACCVGAAVAFGLVVSSGKGHLTDAWWPSISAISWFGTSILLIGILLRWRAATAPLVAVLAVASVVGADLGINNGINESTALPPKFYDVLRTETQNETVRKLKQLLSQPSGSPRRDRVELLGLGFEWPNAGLVHGFDHTLGYNPLRLADFSEAVGTQDTIAEPNQRKFTPLFPSYRCRLADLLGLRYIASPVPITQIDQALREGDLKLVARTQEGYIYENPRALPRVQFVGGWQLADFEGMKATGRWPHIDPHQVVLLEAEPQGAPPEEAPTARAGVTLSRYENTEVEIDVTTTQAGFIVLNDIWHPWWQAEVDGVATQILKANVLFRAVQIPVGSHKIKFSFRPVEGALAELRDRVFPQEADEGVPLKPEIQEQIIADGPSGRVPLSLRGLSPAARDTLNLGKSDHPAEPRTLTSATGPARAW